MKTSRCECGKIIVFDRDVCPKCGRPMTPYDIGSDAEVLSHTSLFTVPEGFTAPIHMVLVELEQGARLLCACKHERDLKIGRKGKVLGDEDNYIFAGDGD